MARRAMALLGLILIGGCAPTPELGRPSVAPWDFADAPNPNPGAPAGVPLVRDPAGLVRAEGPSGKTDNGYRVTLVSVARKLPPGGEDVTPDSLAVWKADGSPALAAAFQNGMAGGAAWGLVDHGARMLTFDIQGPLKSGDTSVMGYLPDGAREGTPHPEFHGWDMGPMSRLWNPSYSTWVVADDRRATRYRIAIADGEWKPLDRVKVRLDRRVDEILHEGDGYRLHHVVIPRPFAATKWTMQDELGRWVAEPDTLAPDWEYRVRFEGAPQSAGAWPVMPRQHTGDAVVLIERRPWHWLELKGVHFDPDPARWPKGGLWGDEGRPTTPRADGATLEAVAAFEKDKVGSWNPTAVYAPDGRRWRAHPDGSGLRARIGGGQPPKDTLLAVLRFEEGRVSRERPALVDILSATSDQPGRDLGKSVSQFRGYTATQEVAHVPFSRPPTPFVQVSVRYADPEWRTAAVVPFPRLAPFPVSPDLRAAFARGTLSAEAFDVSLVLGPQGSRFDLRLSTEPKPRLSRSVSLRNGETEGRIVARLKSGERVPLEPNSSGFGGSGEHSTGMTFYLDRDGGAHYHDNVTSREFRASEIEAFEIQVRGYGPPSYLLAKLP